MENFVLARCSPKSQVVKYVCKQIWHFYLNTHTLKISKSVGKVNTIEKTSRFQARNKYLHTVYNFLSPPVSLKYVGTISNNFL